MSFISTKLSHKMPLNLEYYFRAKFQKLTNKLHNTQNSHTLKISADTFCPWHSEG